MYDKIRFIVYRTKGANEFAYLESFIEKPKRLLDEETGEVGTLFGEKRGLRIREYLWGLSIEGSLNKWLHEGSNLYDMSLADAEQAIGEISEALKTDLLQASVTGIEFGTNLILKNTVSRYFKLLGEMPRRVRNPLSRTSLYYDRRGKRNLDQVIFYDKIAQAKKEKISIPESLTDKNLMRVELRYNGNLGNQLGRIVTGNTLKEQLFYKELKSRLIEKYMSIQKLETINVNNMENIKKPTDAAKIFFSILFAKSGDGQQAIEDYLNQLKDKKVFKDRNDYLRTKKQITRIIESASLSEGDPLRAELDAAFERLKLQG